MQSSDIIIIGLIAKFNYINYAYQYASTSYGNSLRSPANELTMCIYWRLFVISDLHARLYKQYGQKFAFNILYEQIFTHQCHVHLHIIMVLLK